MKMFFCLVLVKVMIFLKIFVLSNLIFLNLNYYIFFKETTVSEEREEKRREEYFYEKDFQLDKLSQVSSYRPAISSNNSYIWPLKNESKFGKIAHFVATYNIIFTYP